MTPTGQEILRHLRAVDDERKLRSGDAGLSRRVEALKQYQRARFANTYTDLLSSARYAAPARFFLEELYGPHDFTERDAQFARIVPALVRLFPEEIVETVHTLADLHAMSEALDTEMARHLGCPHISRHDYVRAWQRTGRAVERDRQIELTVAVGRSLDRYTSNPLLRHSLRLMRRPARAAGLAALQSFLEHGFDTFSAMRGAHAFLSVVASRERALAKRLFEADPVAVATARSREGGDNSDPLGQLP